MEGASDAQEAETITLRVKTLPDGCHTVTIAPSAKIVDLKASLLDIVGIPVDRQRLIFHGRALSDDSVLASVGLEDGNTLHLVERPAGAAPPGAGSDRPSQGPDLQQILQSVMSGALPTNAHVTLSTSTMPNAMPAHMASLLGGSSIGEPPGRRLHTRMGEDAARAGLNREWLALPEVLSNFQDHLASGPPVQRASPDNPAPAGSPSRAEAGAASAPPPPPGEAASGTEARRGGEEPDRAPFMFPLDGRHPAGPMDARSSTAVESLLLAAVRQLQGMQRLPDELEAMRDRALQELAQLPPPDSATRTERYPSSSPSPQPAPGASSGSAGEASAPAASEAAAGLPAGSAGTARRWAEPASGPGRYLRNYDCSVLLAAVAARHVKRTHDLITRHLLPQLLHHSDVVMPMASAALEERRLQAAASGDAQPQTSGSSGGQAEASAPAVADGSLPSEHLRPWEQAGDAGARQRASGTAAAEQQPALTAAARLELEPRRDALARQMEVVGTAVHRYGALLMELAHELARVRTLLRAGSHAQESAAARSFGAAMPAFLEQDGREVLTTTMRPRITAASGSAGRTGPGPAASRCSAAGQDGAPEPEHEGVKPGPPGFQGVYAGSLRGDWPGGGALGRMLSVLPGAVLGMLGAPGARTVESGGLSFSLSGPQPAADSASSPSAGAAGATAAAARSDDGPPEASAGAREGAGLAAAPAPHRSEMQGAPAAPAPASGGGGGDGDAGADDRTLAPGSAAEPEEQSGGPADGGAGAAQWTADGLFQVYSAPIGLSSTPGMLEALSELLDIGDRAVQPPEVDSAGASDAERLAAQGAGLGGAARDILRALSSVMPSHSAIDGQDQPGVPRLVSGLVHVVSLGRARNAQEIAVLRDACERSIPRAAHALQQHLALGEGERASELPLLRLLAAIPALLPQLLSIVQESMLAAGQAAGLPEQRIRELFGVPPEGDLRRPRFLDGLLSLLPLIAQMMPWISPGACPPARPESQEAQQPEAGAEETAVTEEGPAAAEGRSLANLEDDLKAALERISVLEEQLAEKRTAAGHAPGRSTEPPNAADAPPSASAGTQPAEADAADTALESVLQQAGCGGISSFPLPLGNLDSLPVTCLPGVDIVVRPAASDRSGSSNAQAAASAAPSAAARAGGEPPASDSPVGVAAGGAAGPGPAAAPAAPAAGAPAEPRASSKKQPRGLGAGLKPRGLGADLKPRPRKPQDRRELPSASGGSSRAGPSRPDAAAAARELPSAPGPPASRGGPPASGMGGSLSSLLEGLLGGGAPAGQVSGEGVAGAGGGGGHPLMQMLQNPQMQRMTESMMSSPAFQGAAEGLSRGEGRLDLGSIMQQMMPVVQDMLSGTDASMLRQRRAAAQGSAPQSWRDGLSDAEVQRWEATLSRDARAQATASTPPPLSEAYLAGSVGSRRGTGLLDELRGPPAS